MAIRCGETSVSISIPAVVPPDDWLRLGHHIEVFERLGLEGKPLLLRTFRRKDVDRITAPLTRTDALMVIELRHDGPWDVFYAPRELHDALIGCLD